jgi:hypothetical protein
MMLQVEVRVYIVFSCGNNVHDQYAKLFKSNRVST